MMEAEQDESDGFLEVPALEIAARALAAEKAAAAGQLIGPYRVVRLLGAGGMGEVFLAQDTRLGRNVALKLLPAELAGDPSRVRRFEQEARAASALNHPNVLVVYDIGVHDGLPYIASEYLEGETLRRRLSGSALPVGKAVGFAVQIARALAAAHENGIVHRDLKPENLFVTVEERIKVLDFGLAKLADPAHATEAQRENMTCVMTAPGVVMGTLGYLSPEQLRGQGGDHRSDIFALGAVLYEMLTGRPAFRRDSDADTISAILREEPPDFANQNVPPALVRIVSRCLEKSPAERFQSASDVAFTLEAVWSPSGPNAIPVQPEPRRKKFGAPLAWIIGSLLMLAALAVAVISGLRKPAEPALMRFEMALPGGDPSTGGPALALSPDGKYLALLATGPNGEPMLWVRSLDTLTLTPVSSSEGAKYPFWSADSRFLAFQVDNRLKAMEITSGAQRTVCTLRGVVNGAWSAENVILAGTGSGPLLRVSGMRGERPAPVTRIDSSREERSHWWPCFLPDNLHFLYTARAATLENSGIYVGSLDSLEAKRLVSGVTSNAAFAPPGYLLYAREGSLIAHRFDAKRLSLEGEELPIADQLKSYYGYAVFSASQTGTLVYRTGAQARYQLSWFDRAGRQIGPVGSQSQKKWSEGVLPLSPSLSPNGKLLATIQYRAPKGAYDIWVTDLARNNLAFPVTSTSNAEAPVWAPDSIRIAYSAAPKGGERDLFVKRIDDAGSGELLLHSEADKWPLDWSADGQKLLFRMTDAQSRSGLWVLPLNGNPVPKPVVPSSLDVEDGALSPDGRWISYSSRQSGTYEVYVQDFPAGHSRRVVSNAGGRYSHWQRDGKQLFYLSPDDRLMAVPISDDFAGLPRALFKTGAVGADPYTVAPDGQRFLVQTRFPDSTASPITFVLNWPQILKK